MVVWGFEGGGSELFFLLGFVGIFFCLVRSQHLLDFRLKMQEGFCMNCEIGDCKSLFNIYTHLFFMAVGVFGPRYFFIYIYTHITFMLVIMQIVTLSIQRNRNIYLYFIYYEYIYIYYYLMLYIQYIY